MVQYGAPYPLSGTVEIVTDRVRPMEQIILFVFCPKQALRVVCKLQNNTGKI